MGYGPPQAVVDRTITVDDDYVHQDYANTTIPRTINYVAGLINYFLRGSIEVAIGCPQGCNPSTGAVTYSMTITNTSKNSSREQVLKGGSFEFYWDDLSGNRTKVDNFAVYDYDEADTDTTDPWNQDSLLPYGEHIRAKATFTLPQGKSCTDVNDYIVIYKGSINDSEYPNDTDTDDPNAMACWVKSASPTAPATSYTFLITEWGGTDYYSPCAEYLKHIFDYENPNGYTLPRAPNSDCNDCRWRATDAHICSYGSPYCPSSCFVTQIMTLYSPLTDQFCVLITPFPVTYCGFNPYRQCNGSYKRCFNRQQGESYEEFWERIFNGGVFGDESEADCDENGCKIPALWGWTDSWVRVIWVPNY